MTEKTIEWAAAPTEDDRFDAGRFLTLLGVTRAVLDDRDQVFYLAKDLLRAARLPGLPQSNAGVAKWLKRIKSGDQVPPVLLVQGNRGADLPLIIAEGYHRVSACYLLDEQTLVAGHFLNVV